MVSAESAYYLKGYTSVNVKVIGDSRQNIWKYKMKYDATKAFIEDTSVTRFREMCNPYVVSPFKISEKLSKSALQSRKQEIEATMKLNSSISPINFEYMREAYYFVPVQIAVTLTQKGHYEEALDWFRTVYDYSQPNNTTFGESNRRKIFYGLEREEIYGKDFDRTMDWLEDPLNPHAIAATRSNTYTRYTLMTITKCMQAYADSLYTEDTAESVPKARLLYQTANELISLLLPEPNANVLENLTVTTTNQFFLSRWNELKIGYC